MNDVDRAIAIVTASRETHVNWLRYAESDEPYRCTVEGCRFDHKAAELRIAGDADHHRQAIAGYDHVLAVLTDPPSPSLDAAWSRAGAALPEGWQMHLSHRADGAYSARAIDLVNADKPRASVEYAGPLPAPAAALNALAEKLEKL